MTAAVVVASVQLAARQAQADRLADASFERFDDAWKPPDAHFVQPRPFSPAAKST